MSKAYRFNNQVTRWVSFSAVVPMDCGKYGGFLGFYPGRRSILSTQWSGEFKQGCVRIPKELVDELADPEDQGKAHDIGDPEP